MNTLIEFEIPETPLNMNGSDSPAARRDFHRRKEVWRNAAYYAAVAAFPGKGPLGRTMPPCDVYISIPVAGARRRDPSNWFPTLKVCIDGLVQAGIWPDDTPEYVTTHEPGLREVAPSELLREKVYVRLVPR